MPIVDILGWVAAALSTVLSLPQLIRLIRAGTSAGLSLVLWQCLMAAGFGWTVHGLSVGRPNMWVPNLVMALCSIAIIRLIARDRNLRAVHAWTTPLVLLAALVTIDTLWGAVAYGVATSVPQVIGAAAQLFDVARSLDITGLSPFYVTMAVVVQGVWLTWGVLAHEMAVVVSATANGFVVLVTWLWYLARRLGATAITRGRGAGRPLAHEVADVVRSAGE
ncbi:SemiSWEET family sugar transporter [Propionibacteriaceae bacterium Y1923]